MFTDVPSTDPPFTLLPIHIYPYRVSGTNDSQEDKGDRDRKSPRSRPSFSNGKRNTENLIKELFDLV